MEASTPTRADVRVLQPANAVEAVRLAGSHGAPYVAAGTWLQPRWEKAGLWPETVVDIGGLPELDHWDHGRHSVRLGALTPLARLSEDPGLAGSLPMLGGICRRLAGPGVRHLATLGGNVASRGDLVPILLALDATVTVAGLAGQRSLPLSEYLSDGSPAALLCHMDIPLRPGRRTYAEKLGHREAFSPAVVTIAACLELDRRYIASAALAVGGGPGPRRLPRAEALLAGRPAADPPWSALAAAIGDDLQELTDGYQARTAHALLTHGLRQTLATEVP